MIKNIFKLLLVFWLVIFQITFMPYLAVKGIWPNLILVLALVLLLCDFENDSLFLAAIGGLIFDLATESKFGIFTLFFIGIVLLFRLFVKKFFPEASFVSVSLTAFLGSVLFSFYSHIVIWQLPSRYIFIEAFYSAFIAIILFFLIKFSFKNSQPIFFRSNNEHF